MSCRTKQNWQFYVNLREHYKKKKIEADLKPSRIREIKLFLKWPATNFHQSIDVADTSIYYYYMFIIDTIFFMVNPCFYECNCVAGLLFLNVPGLWFLG